jgi:hypothetical protein
LVLSPLLLCEIAVDWLGHIACVTLV